MKLPTFRLRTLIGLVAIVGLFFAFLSYLERQRQMRDAWGRQGECYSSLNNIAIALHNYHDEYRCFPRPFEADAHGVKKHSWRPFLLRWFAPDYPQASSYNYGEVREGPVNRGLSTDVPGFLQCTSEKRHNPHGSPFMLINDFGDTPGESIPSNAILVVEAWGANRNWLDPNDRIQLDPHFKVHETDHPEGFGVILRDFSRVREKDTSRIRKDGKYYVLHR